MFDINEYYIEMELLSEANFLTDNEIVPPEEAIEQDIRAILGSTSAGAYNRLKFKRKKHAIDIFTPAKYCPFAGEFTIHPDYFRFLLSVYPDTEDLRKISNIIFRPRFIESDGIQIVSLYSQSSTTLLIYFSYPHTYSFNDYSFFTNTDCEIDISTITNNHYLGTTSGRESQLTIPPLFYILKMISTCPSNSIDKYLLRLGTSVDSAKLVLLDELSHFYRQYGY